LHHAAVRYVSFEFYTDMKEMINSFDLDGKICVIYQNFFINYS